jgi:hypothetical protein
MTIGVGGKCLVITARHFLGSSEQKSQAFTYSSTAIALHWVIAALILVNVVLGFGANYVPDEYVRQFVDLHKSIASPSSV